MARVLFFEDDLTLQVVLFDLFDYAGITPIVGALDSRTATKQIRLADYDLVLTDMQMPNYSGVDVLEWVQRCCPGIPVVALTGAPPDQLKRLGCDPTQYDAFLFKPAKLEDLLNVVDRLISDREASRPPTLH